VLSRRQKIGLVCFAFYVVLAAGLAVAQFAAGAWVQGTAWSASAVGFAAAYGITVARIRRA
jgi:hypothetical protein